MSKKDRKKREECEGVSIKDWSGYFKKMIPKCTNLPEGANYEYRTGDGFIYTADETTFVNYENECGIYEWQARRNGESATVYVGSTCRAKRGGLGARIREYCTNGSHKNDLIDKAIKRGCELWVRVKVYDDKDAAQDAENELLDEYDYAWNKRRNGKIRINKVLP